MDTGHTAPGPGIELGLIVVLNAGEVPLRYLFPSEIMYHITPFQVIAKSLASYKI